MFLCKRLRKWKKKQFVYKWYLKSSKRINKIVRYWEKVFSSQWNSRAALWISCCLLHCCNQLGLFVCVNFERNENENDFLKQLFWKYYMPLIGNTSTFKLSFSLYIRKKLIEPMFETAVSLLLSFLRYCRFFSKGFHWCFCVEFWFGCFRFKTFWLG